jgi:hypothetical protein
MKTALRSSIEAFREEPQRLFYLALLGFLFFWVLRGCLPTGGMPSEVIEAIERTYITCISPEDTPIQPGVSRQPECGKVHIDQVAEGVVPGLEQASGVTRALCYRVLVEYPRWQTLGQTRHEVLWSERSYSKVAVLENEKWRIFPDVDMQDEQRWLGYGCPGAYGENSQVISK